MIKPDSSDLTDKINVVLIPTNEYDVLISTNDFD
jgi:hypothetical protein